MSMVHSIKRFKSNPGRLLPGIIPELLIFCMVCSSLINQAGAQADTVPLARVLDWGQQHFKYDQTVQWEREIERLELEKMEIEHYPSFSLNAQASYQSDVVDFPFEIPSVSPLELPHLRTQLNLQIDQVIFDGGINRLQQQVRKIATEVKEEEINIEREAIQDRLVELYFNVLLLQNAQRAIRSSLELLKNKKESLQAAMEGGIVMRSDLLELEAGLIDLVRDSSKREHRITGLKDMLETLLDRNLEEVIFVLPQDKQIPNMTRITDPRLRLLDKRKQILDRSAEIAQANIRPRVNAYSQAGLGYPNPLNLFDNDLSPYFTGGLRMSWPVWDWDLHQKEQEIVQLHSDILDESSRHRTLQIQSTLDNYLAEINYLDESLEMDRKSIEKRRRIRQLKSVRLDKGIINSNEYLEAVHRERTAVLRFQRHRIELARAKIKYLLESGIGLND